MADEWDEEAIIAALFLMNKVMMPFVGKGNRAIIKAATAYEIPSHDADVETLTEQDIQQVQLPEVVVVGEIGCVQWFGSMSLRGFGLRMFDARFIEPTRHTAETLYVPVETIDCHLAAQ